jgi:hypothetical protein
MSVTEVDYRAVQAVGPGKLELTEKPAKAEDAYRRIFNNEARFRIVLVTGQ